VPRATARGGLGGLLHVRCEPRPLPRAAVRAPRVVCLSRVEAAGTGPSFRGREQQSRAHEVEDTTTPYSSGGGTTPHSVLTSHYKPVPTTPYSSGGGTTEPESSRAWPPHRPQEYGLAHPTDTSRSNLAFTLGLLSRRLSKPLTDPDDCQLSFGWRRTRVYRRCHYLPFDPAFEWAPGGGAPRRMAQIIVTEMYSLLQVRPPRPQRERQTENRTK
jgi:hypothetical protein